MKKSTKGAFAAGAAGVLLLGGAGSLAYWTDAGTIEGSSITAGHLKLTAAVSGCGDWKLNGATFAVGSERIVPGDTLSRHCDYVVDAKGTSLKAKVDISSPTATGTLAGGVTPSATYTVGLGNAVPAGTASPIKDGDSVGVDIKVDFPIGAAADNKYNKLTALTAALSDITVTATQDH